MKKVRLKLDELQLESFNLSDDPSQHRGTVNGHANPTDEGATCACNAEDCTAICQSDACNHDEGIQGFATYIGSGGFATYIGSGGFATYIGSGG